MPHCSPRRGPSGRGPPVALQIGLCGSVRWFLLGLTWVLGFLLGRSYDNKANLVCRSGTKRRGRAVERHNSAALAPHPNHSIRRCRDKGIPTMSALTERRADCGSPKSEMAISSCLRTGRSSCHSFVVPLSLAGFSSVSRPLSRPTARAGLEGAFQYWAVSP